MHAPNQQPQSQGPLFLWSIGFLALGTLSAIGASSLFPWYLAIIIAILVAGLASACAYQLRRTKNLLFLVATVAMTLLAAGLDGVSVWEILNKRHNGHLSVVTAEQSVLESELSKAEARIQVSHEEIDLLIEEATTMDNDGMGHNDHMIPGKLEKIRSKRETLAGLKEELELLRAEVLDATAATAQTDTGRHVLLQMASEREEPAQWLIGCAALVFMIPEFTLVLLAWSLRGPGDHQPPYLPTPQPEPSPTQPETVQLQAPKGRGVAALTGKMNGEAIVPPLFANSAPAGFGEIMELPHQSQSPLRTSLQKPFLRKKPLEIWRKLKFQDAQPCKRQRPFQRNRQPPPVFPRKPPR